MDHGDQWGSRRGDPEARRGKRPPQHLGAEPTLLGAAGTGLGGWGEENAPRGDWLMGAPLR